MLLRDLQVVLKVAEFQSITAAATHLDMTAPTASTAVKRVENALGVKLFIRTTRRLRLSVEGERYIPQCEQALRILQQASKAIKSHLEVIDDELRIAVSSDLGRNLLRPWLNNFMDQYPKVRIRLSISDSNIDLVRESADLALRYLRHESIKATHLYGFKICNVPHLLCASTAYLDKHGVPCHPGDLSAHNGLLYQLYDTTHDVWVFAKNGKSYKVRMNSNRTANDGDMVRRWCLDGKGLAIKSCLDAAADLLSGRLVNVMPEYQPSSTELWLICPGRQLITPATRLLRDTIKRECSDILTKLVEKGFLDNTVVD